MKSKINLILKAMPILLLFAGCGTGGLMRDVPLYTVSEYGYSAQNPVALWAPTDEGKQAITASYLERLRSKNGDKLEILLKTSIPNPLYRDPKIKIYNIFTDEIINASQSKFLELYSLYSPAEGDTIKIYVDNHTKASLMVPAGLSFASN